MDDDDSDSSMEASRNTDEHRSPGRADTRDHEARPHSVLVPSVSTLTRDTAASSPSLKRTTLLDLCVSSLRREHANLLCIVPREIHELCVSSLLQGRAIFTILQGLTPSWSRNFRNAQRASSCFIDQKNNNQYLHSRIMRVILAQRSCPVLQILDVSSCKRKKGPPKAEYPPEVAEKTYHPCSNRFHSQSR